MRLGFNPLEGSFDFKAPHEQVTDSINASTSKVVEVIALVDFVAIEYGFQLTDGTDARSFKMLVTQDAGNLKDSVFAKAGSLNIAIDATIQSGNMEIEITNNETSSIDLTFTRIIL